MKDRETTKSPQTRNMINLSNIFAGKESVSPSSNNSKVNYSTINKNTQIINSGFPWQNLMKTSTPNFTNFSKSAKEKDSNVESEISFPVVKDGLNQFGQN